MTLVVLWKTKKAVFMAADSAVTSTVENWPHSNPHSASTFMEPQVIGKNESDIRSAEAVLKIVELPRAAIAFAGSAIIGKRIVRQIQVKMREEGIAARKALENVIGELSKESSEHVQVGLIGCEDEPWIMTWNHRSSGAFEHHATICMLGAVGQPQGDLLAKTAQNVFSSMLQNDRAISEKAILACFLGILQRFGVTGELKLMARGIGGVYSGLWIDEDDVHWQPNVIYVLLDPKTIEVAHHVAVVRWKECLIAWAPDRYLVQVRQKYGESKEELRQRMSEFDVVQAGKERSKIDYVTLISGGAACGLWVGGIWL